MSVALLREAWQRVAIGERVALATVVATRGSTPQKVGARLLVRGDGGMLGTLGGGAVEAEAVREAAVRLGWGEPVLRQYALTTGTDEWGLACGGTMVVFIESLDDRSAGWLRAVAEAADRGESVAVVTVVEGGDLGARLVVSEGGVAGSLGDPALTAEGRQLGQRVLASQEAELVPAGAFRIHAETLGPGPALVIVGAGHVGKALAGLAKALDVRVTVVDDRPEYASRERFPEADELVAAPVAEALGRLGVTPRTAIVVAMRNHDLDYEGVAAALRTRARYVGLIGSRRKAVLVAERLLTAGIPAERVRALRSPIGLDLGGQTPAEIALAILGEWIMVRQGASGVPLMLGDALFAKAAGRAVASGGSRADGA
jgi:xanthine dehydrogenase accessory factor